MKRLSLLLTVLLSAVMIALCVVYYQKGGNFFKGTCSAAFTAVGAVNLIFCAVEKRKKLFFPVLTFSGLFLCAAGDVLLLHHFIFGAALFVCGHVLYVIAYCTLEKPSAKDILFIAAVAAISLCVVTLVPAFNYGSALMEAVAVVYAVVISFMLGKALSNLICKGNGVNAAIAVGSLLFFVSDIALAFNIFGGAPAWSNPLCLVTYFPGQLLIAWSLYLYSFCSAKENS